MAASTRRGTITQRSAVIAKRWMRLAASPEPGARISASAVASGTDWPSHGCGGSEDGGQQRVDLGGLQERCSPTSRGTRRRCRGRTCRRSSPPRARDAKCSSARPRAMTSGAATRRHPGRYAAVAARATSLVRSATPPWQPGGPLGHPHQQSDVKRRTGAAVPRSETRRTAVKAADRREVPAEDRQDRHREDIDPPRGAERAARAPMAADVTSPARQKGICVGAAARGLGPGRRCGRARRPGRENKGTAGVVR